MPDSTTKKWYGFVPNMFTILNLVCGLVAIVFVFNGKIQYAMLLLFGGAFFDFIDGFVARLLNVSSELGKQLDSLSDLVTFGILPGVMLFSLQESYLLLKVSSIGKFNLLQWILYISPILIPVFSALRLAKFNIDVRQSESFIGLPTPANALFFASLVWVLTFRSIGIWHFLSNPIALALLIVVFSYLLIAELPLFSLKFKKKKGKDNSIRFIFLLSSLFILVFLKIEGLPFVILLYILLSLLKPLLVKIIYKP
jgi:CDP-diacylglycerol--serine O-phosphatidyltransferase